jgi:hypothetical protein
MPSDSGPKGPRSAPQIDVRVDLAALDGATRERIAQVIERSVREELAGQDEVVLAQLPQFITMGVIGQDPPPNGA